VGSGSRSRSDREERIYHPRDSIGIVRRDRCESTRGTELLADHVQKVDVRFHGSFAVKIKQALVFSHLTRDQIMTEFDPTDLQPGGIDILIQRGSTLPQILVALETACGLSAQDVIHPADDIMRRLDVLQRPLRARIFTMSGGDFDYKVDIDGFAPLDYTVLARRFGGALGHGVMILDQTKPDPFSAILMCPGAADTHGYIEDAEPDGASFHPLGLGA
jgi:hypothetical protein